jgi:hypothetical protein
MQIMGDNISRQWFRGHCIICSERGKEKNRNKNKNKGGGRKKGKTER